MDERIGSTPPPIAPAAVRAARRKIRDVAKGTIPSLADFAVVFVLDGRSIVGIATAHVTPDGERLLRALQRVYRVRVADLQSTVAQVIRNGRPAVRNGITHDHVRVVRRGSVADLHRRLGARSALVIPIANGSGVFGALTLCYAGSGRAYTRADIPAGRRVARALVRAVSPDGADAAIRLRAAAGHARPKSAGR
jgi:GAF domain-containing protein